MCVSVWISTNSFVFVRVSCILVNVFGLGKFNKYKSQTHLIHKEMGQRRETEMWTLCLQALLGPCVFYIMCKLFNGPQIHKNTPSSFEQTGGTKNFSASKKFLEQVHVRQASV